MKTDIFHSRIVYGGHTWHPAFAPSRAPSEAACLDLLAAAHGQGILHLDATYEAEVQVLGHLLPRCGLDFAVGCLQFFGISPTPAEQRAQLLRWTALLGRTAIDHLYVFPAPNAAQAAELRRQREQGVVRALGFWLRSPDDSVDVGLFDFVAGVFNPARPELAPRLAALRAEGLRVLVLEALGGGSLIARRPASQRETLARTLLDYALSQTWCDAVAVTMRTRREVASAATAARAATAGMTRTHALPPVELRYAEDTDPWVRGKSLEPWDGRFGSGEA